MGEIEKKAAEYNRWFNNLSKEGKKHELCRKIRNAVCLEIHSNVCYLLNFCDMPQELATELSEHYNAIDKKIKAWEKEEGRREKCLEQNKDGTILPCEVMKENEEHNLLIDIIEAFTSQSLTDDGEMADTAREIAEILGIKNYR